MQEALKITTPDSGVLFEDMLFQTGDAVPAGRFIQPRVEAEIAFVMRTSLAGADVTRDDVIAATLHVAPALEILDTRVLRADPATGQPRIITDTISDNAANAGIELRLANSCAEPLQYAFTPSLDDAPARHSSLPAHIWKM